MSINLFSSVFFGLFKMFGNAPWLERFCNIGFNKKLFKSLVEIIRVVSGNGNLDGALNDIKNNKELELEFQRELIKLEDSYFKEMVKDRANARDRDLALQKMRGHNKRANFMFIVAIIGVACSLLFMFAFKPRLTNSDIVAIVSGFAATFGYGLRSVYDFEFGGGGGFNHSSRSRRSRNYQDYDDDDDFKGTFLKLNKYFEEIEKQQLL